MDKRPLETESQGWDGCAEIKRVTGPKEKTLNGSERKGQKGRGDYSGRAPPSDRKGELQKQGVTDIEKRGTGKDEHRLAKTGKGRKVETKTIPVHHVGHEERREQEKERSREGEMERVNRREEREEKRQE